MYDAEQQKEYDEAMAKLEAGDQPITSAEEVGLPAEPEAVAPEAKDEPAAEVVVEPVVTEVDPVEELRTKLEKAEKALKDTQAWGTKNAQRLAEIEKERLLQQREASRPQILEANPDLEDAIRHVVSDPTPNIQAQERHNQWASMIDAAHPGIFQVPDGDELVTAIAERAKELGDEWHNPLIAIREITAQKLAHTERQLAKKYEAEVKTRAQKSAMSVPGAGGSAAPAAPIDPDKAEVIRIQNMSDADFEKERKKARGF